jgi:lipoyl(octanoyl) transferase
MRNDLGSGLFWTDAGTISYAQGLALQEQFHKLSKADEKFGMIIKLEHHPVLTLGKNALAEHLLMSRETFAQKNITVYDTDRGGEVTAHMPGQLVVYPVLNITALNFTPKKYVAFLLGCVCEALKKFGVDGKASDEFPGVWVDREKICAVGVRFKERVTQHGIAININNDLALFNHIVPCGLTGLGVTSLAKVTKTPATINDFWPVLLAEFTRILGPIAPTETPLVNCGASAYDTPKSNAQMTSF